METFDIAIIGTGPAGISAAITAKVRNKKILLIGQEVSEKVRKSHSILNYPGLPNISGEELAQRFMEHLSQLDIKITSDRISTVYAMGEYFQLKGIDSDYQSKKLIIATGTNFGKPILGEKEFLGRGVSYCATCDGNFYKGKRIAVLGFAEDSKKETEYLSSIASEVLYFNCSKNPELDVRSFKEENIRFIEEDALEIFGGMRANGLKTKENRTYDVDGIFIIRDAVSPEQLVPGLEVENNHIKVDRKMKTNLENCYACGDITGTPYQYIKAAGEGNVAALSAVTD